MQGASYKARLCRTGAAKFRPLFLVVESGARRWHMAESRLSLADQAVLIWPVLVFAARMQRVLTYGDVHDFTGIPAHFQGEPLYLIHRYCERKKDYPLLNSIVVSADTGFPGDGFPKKMTPQQHLEERARVFAYGWSGKDKPRREDFDVPQSATA